MKSHSEPLRRFYAPMCPACGGAVASSWLANGGSPGEPDAPQWGEPGARRLLCQAGAWAHIDAGDGRERLFYMAKIARPRKVTAR